VQRRQFLAAATVTAVTAVAGCVASAEQGDFDVGMSSDDFEPQSTVEVPESAPAWVPRDVPTVEVTVGDPLVWENTGSRNHTVTAATREHHEVEALLGVAADDHHEEPPRLPPGGTFFASGGFSDELSAARSFVRELNGGGAIPPGERYTHTFDSPGWYH